MDIQRSTTEEFQVSGLKYELVLPSVGSLGLFLVGGRRPGIGDIRKANSESSPFDHPWTEDDFDFGLVDDHGYGVNAFQLSKIVTGKIVNWVKTRRPGYFSLSASTVRKRAIYKRISKNIHKRISNEYNYQHYSDVHAFYRAAA